ncbi:hypothetical protein FB451DRAFT_142420 [Mycena latifolia]|nr:hypothetical protein FB451DRAFT_142420 [Mycena latifolia]
MSLAHKLRKMDNLDIEKTRDDEQAEKTGETTQERQVRRPSSSANLTHLRQSQDAETSTSKGADSPENAVPSLRPLTRSLTGRASKPRARDDSWYEPPKKSPAGRKKAPKLSRKRTIDEVDKAESEEPQEQAPPPPPPAPEPAVPPLNSTQAVFVDASLDPLVPPSGEPRIGSRSRTNLPVPVPNLIKKSRGRRVPVVAGANGNGEEEVNKRLHVCKVEGCGKCFHRGEHLKRHIRSIHTHEKPFPCTFPSCHKFFNRHDNLLQHVKVHRNGEDDIDIDAEGSPAPDDSRPASPANDGFDGARIAALSLHHHSTAITYPTLGAAPVSYGPTTQSSSYATNMAVSSLRTELPDSPSKGVGESPYALHHVHEDDQQDDREQHYAQRPSDERHYAAQQASDEQHYAHPGQQVSDERHYAQQPPDEQHYAQQSSDEHYSPPVQQSSDEQHYEHPAPQADASTAPLPPSPEQQQYVFPAAQQDVAMHTDAPAQAQAEHPQPNGHAPPPSAPAPQSSYYRLRTPPPPAPAMAQPQEWQATF